MYGIINGLRVLDIRMVLQMLLYKPSPIANKFSFRLGPLCLFPKGIYDTGEKRIVVENEIYFSPLGRPHDTNFFLRCLRFQCFM